jgi:hypothetical protein
MSDVTDDPHTFFVESHFQKMARRAGGIPRRQALENAQIAIDKIKLSFGDWLDGETASLAAAIKQGQSAAPGDITWVEAGLVHARQIRDVGTTMGFELATFISANLCEMFEAIIAGAPPRHDLIECHKDAMVLAKQEQYRHLRPDQLPELSTGLRRILDVGTSADPKKS